MISIGCHISFDRWIGIKGLNNMAIMINDHIASSCLVPCALTATAIPDIQITHLRNW